MATKIRVGDTVIIRKGRDKGTTGKVVQLSSDGTKVKVEGVNVQVKHQKPNQRPGVDGGLYKNPGMISVANVGHVHPTDKKRSARIGFTVEKDGAKKRVYKMNGKEIK